MRSPLGLAGRSIAPRGMREKLALCCGPAERQETWRGSTAGIARGLCGSFVTNFVIRILSSLKLARSPSQDPLYVARALCLKNRGAPPLRRILQIWPPRSTFRLKLRNKF
jgi:hypothetical protein